MAKRSQQACFYDLCFDLDEALMMQDMPKATPPPPPLPTVFSAGICTVCLQTFDAGEGAKSMPCGHPFHDTCISRWLARVHSCPTCRCPLKSDE